MHMINDKGEAVYFNPIRKNGKDQWLIQGIGSTIVLGRDRVSCWCCCNKNLKELRNIRKYLPLYWEKLKDLQRQLERPMKGFYKGQPRGVFELGERFMKEEAEHEKAQEIPAPGQALDV